MTSEIDTPPPEPTEQIAAAYGTCYDLLAYLAVQRFHMPDADVPDVIHHVFVAFIRNQPKIRNTRTWLIGAMYNQCRLYWRARGRDDILSEFDGDFDATAYATDATMRVDVARVLQRLPRRCRELLHLRYFEELSSEEIARHFATTIDYARKLVHRCVVSARMLFDHRRPERKL